MALETADTVAELNADAMLISWRPFPEAVSASSAGTRKSRDGVGGTAVERKPQTQEVMGSTFARCWVIL